jgi:protein-disulfide isomerase
VRNRVGERQATRVVREQLASEKRRKRRAWVTIGAVAVLLIAGLIGWGIYATNRPDTSAIPAGTTNDGGTNAGLAAGGTGPVKVEVYFDFLCPFCQQFEAEATPTLDQLIATNKITLVWHPLGFLNASSTPAGYSTRAASSSACASDLGKLKPYGQALFAAQPAEGSPGLSDDQLIDIAGTVGIINPTFAGCVRAAKYAGWVTNGNDLAARRGVTATPTVFVNGKQVPQPTGATVLAAVTAAG